MKLLFIRIFFLLNLLFYLISPQAQALVDLSLYEDQLPVSDSSILVREQAIPQILQKVLMKISGNSSITIMESIKSKLINASSLVESYSYTALNDGTPGQLILTVRFDQRGIDQFLKTLKNKSDQPITTIQVITIIKGIKNLDDYTAINQYFSSLATVAKVENIGIEKDYIKLKITSTANLDELTNAINAGNKLAVIPPDDKNQDVNLTCTLK